VDSVIIMYFQNLKSRNCCNVYNGLRQKEIQTQNNCYVAISFQYNVKEAIEFLYVCSSMYCIKPVSLCISLWDVRLEQDASCTFITLTTSNF
jgi:hypothetical protein